MRRKIRNSLAVGFLALGMCSCATTQPEVIQSSKSALEVRSMQSRSFETGDTKHVFRAVLSTLQDLGYTIIKLEPDAGTVTGDKLAQLKMTVMVYPRGLQRTIVRANAIVKLSPQVEQAHQVDDPEFYQQLFLEPLSKALFLSAMEIKEDDEKGKKEVAPKDQDELKKEDAEGSG